MDFRMGTTGLPPDYYLTKVKVMAVDGPRPLDYKRKADQLMDEHIRRIESFKAGTLPQGKDEPRLNKLLEDLEWLESYILKSKVRTKFLKVSRNPVDLITARSQGFHRRQSTSYSRDFITRHLIHHGLWKERSYSLGTYNKVFCCEWLSDSRVIMGTKCNSLIVLDILTGKINKIDCLKSSGRHVPPESTCGIHATEANPSRNLLATGGESPCELAVYRLPTFGPVCVGEGSHKDWIFDLKWLDDEFLVTGSRDSTLSLWRINDTVLSETGEDLLEVDEEEMDTDRGGVAELPRHVFVKPLINVPCKDGVRIRSLTFNQDEPAIGALSLNSRFHLFDPVTMTVKSQTKLPTPSDNVCLAYFPSRKGYGIGSKNCVVIMSDNLKSHHRFNMHHRHSGVRSITFTNDLLTIGTGSGEILFADTRMMKFLSKLDFNTVKDPDVPIISSIPPEEPMAYLSSSPGFVCRDEAYYEAFLGNMAYSPAIYTHRYDASGMRLFAAGGPLPASLWGNYAALWL